MRTPSPSETEARQDLWLYRLTTWLLVGVTSEKVLTVMVRVASFHDESDLAALTFSAPGRLPHSSVLRGGAVGEATLFMVKACVACTSSSASKNS